MTQPAEFVARINPDGLEYVSGTQQYPGLSKGSEWLRAVGALWPIMLTVPTNFAPVLAVILIGLIQSHYQQRT